MNSKVVKNMFLSLFDNQRFISIGSTNRSDQYLTDKHKNTGRKVCTYVYLVKFVGFVIKTKLKIASVNEIVEI